MANENLREWASQRYSKLRASEPEVYEAISHLSVGDRGDTKKYKKDFNKLVGLYEINPAVFKEVLQTIDFTSELTGEEIKRHLKIQIKGTKFSYENLSRKKDLVLNFTQIFGTGVLSYSLLNLIYDVANAAPLGFDLYDATSAFISGIIFAGAGYRCTQQERDLCENYKKMKERADRILGCKRVRGTNQLELLLEN